MNYHTKFGLGKKVPGGCVDCQVNFEDKFSCDDCPIDKEGFDGDTWEIEAARKERDAERKKK